MAIFLLVFAAYPMVQLVRMSLSEVEIAGGEFVWSGAGLANYAEFPDDDIARYSFLITVVFIAVTVPATVILGTVLAVLVRRATLLAGLARNVLLWPALIAPVVVSVIWWLILSPNFGTLNKVLESLGLPPQGWLGSSSGAIVSIIVVDVWHWAPLVFILIYAALQGIEPDLIEAAEVDGATEWQVHRHVVLPLLVPAIAAASLIRLTMGAKAFDEMYVLTQGGPGTATTLVSLYIRNVFFDRLDLGYGAAVSVLVILAIGAVLALVAIGRAVGPGKGPAHA
ncbi:sugar ABC transporter permease [Phytoactinopolyspora alkaliphila]|uniref:Sugar ABC transporter permease n=1 Tax=Phytoactinopolyspora alkaliphila TaxID=1783498 RepID=A0A6N9YRV8_9ACTN|nr:sugar ABC transporter permease [Phytoactinopolyspora alkaliphila]NED97796.1 sugar ABC transporter permease [Phytoactinopolyspora alkaliphila]